MTADLVVFPVTENMYRQQVTIADSGIHVASFYAKKGTSDNVRTTEDYYSGATLTFDLTNCTVLTGTTGGISSEDNGWCRIWQYRNYTAAQVSFITISSLTDNTTLYIGGAQLEISPSTLPTPYIPTVASSVTASFQPSDNVLFKRGQTWAETPTVPSSGTSGAHITYGAYSTGTYPSISGFDANGQTYVDYGAETITLTDTTGATFNTVYTSNAVQYAGIDNQVAVSISGTGCTYSLNGGAYTASADNVIVNDNVTVRKTSSGAASTGVSCVLTMGASSDTYTVTTRYGIPGRFPEWPTEPSFPTWR
jgi:hypothetical protein